MSAGGGGIPIGGIEFLGEFFRALRTGGVLRIVRAAGATSIAFRLVIPVLRTAGFFYNRLLRAQELTPAQRLALGTTFGFPAGINPFLFSFLSGFAFPDRRSLVQGWLSSLGQLVFKDVPGIESDLEDRLRQAGKTDFRAVLDTIATFYAEELGIDDAAAFFKGIGAAGADFESLIGIKLPITTIGNWIIWLDKALRGTFDPLPKPPTFRPGEVVPLDPGLRRGLEAKTRKQLPGAIKRLTMNIIRKGPQATLFKIGETVSQGVKDKLRDLVLRRLS